MTGIAQQHIYFLKKILPFLYNQHI